MISEHITEAEAFKSQQAIRLGIKNYTDDEILLENMRFVANNIFEPIRKHFAKPIGISSFYRCVELNKKIKGAKNSQHTTGEAIDIDADIFGGLINTEIYNFVKDNLTFDQLIWEYGDNNNPAWVHVSLKREGKNRGQILRVR
jgi:zinc D-Ala-D-Ala carboxypeptidase